MKNTVKLFTTLSLLLMAIWSSAQSRMPEVEMADALRENGKIYVVVIVLCIVFAGIIGYLVIIDRKLSKLEKQRKK